MASKTDGNRAALIFAVTTLGVAIIAGVAVSVPIVSAHRERQEAELRAFKQAELQRDLDAKKTKASADRAAATTRRTTAKADAEREARNLVKVTPKSADAGVLATGDAAVDLTTTLLKTAERNAEGGDESATAAFRSALTEASRILEFQVASRQSAMQPDLDLVVGEMLYRHGPRSGAVHHLARALEATQLELGDDERFDATMHLARAEFETGVAADSRSGAKILFHGEPADSLKRLEYFELQCDLLRAAGQRDKLREMCERRVELARSVANQNPSALHDAVDALAECRQLGENLEGAEQLLRDQLKAETTIARADEQLLTKVRLAWVLFDRGRMAEAQSLDAEIRTAIGAGLSKRCLNDRIIVDYLMARKAWALAEPLLTDAWRRSADPMTSQLERERIAQLLVALFEGSDRPQLAATWQQTLEQLRAARDTGGGKKR